MVAERTAERVSSVRGHSPAVGAWDGRDLVGFARAVSDGVLRAYAEDVVVSPGWCRPRVAGRAPGGTGPDPRGDAVLPAGPGRLLRGLLLSAHRRSRHTGRGSDPGHRLAGHWAATTRPGNWTQTLRLGTAGSSAEDHSHTLTAVGNLADDLRALGEHQAARELNEDTLARYRRVLGEDHPDTLASAGNLAHDLHALGET
jgi:hypothetical protein